MSEARNVRPSGDPVIPDKLYFRIGEVARLLNVETHTLRFWETEFPQLRVGKGGTGQRLYRRRDVELVLEIKHLLYEQGYTIPGARQLLQSRNRRDPVEPKPTKTAAASSPAGQNESGLHRIRAELRHLSQMLSDAPGIPAAPVKRPRNLPGPSTGAPPRHGLHLASGKTRPGNGRSAPSPGAPGASPGLFDHEAE